MDDGWLTGRSPSGGFLLPAHRLPHGITDGLIAAASKVSPAKGVAPPNLKVAEAFTRLANAPGR